MCSEVHHDVLREVIVKGSVVDSGVSACKPSKAWLMLMLLRPLLSCSGAVVLTHGWLSHPMPS